MNMEKTAAAYIRVSTEDQTELSPDSQLKEIKRYAQTNGFELPEEFVFIDAGISGRNTIKRPEFNNMISVAKTKPKPFDTILVWKFSRFARNREDSIVYKSMLRKDCGIDVVSISEPTGDDAISVLIEALIEAMDEYYSINLSTEVRRGMKEKAERGGVVTMPAYGYLINSGEYVIDEKKAKVVRTIFDYYLNGAGLREIAKRLNESAVPSAKGGLWQMRSVEYILRNPIYIGKIRWNPERVTSYHTNKHFYDENIIIAQGQHKPIIDEDSFNKSQERHARMRALYSKGEHQSTPIEFMLRGLIKCSACGATLSPIRKGTSLQCCGYLHGKCTESHNILVRLIIEAVIEQIRKDVEFDNFTITPTRDKKIEIKSDIKEQIERLQLKLKRAMDAYENEVYNLDEFKLRKKKLDDDIKKLESEQKTVTITQNSNEVRKSSIEAGLKIFIDDSVSISYKNQVLRQIIKKIVFNRKESEIEIFYF